MRMRSIPVTATLTALLVILAAPSQLCLAQSSNIDRANKRLDSIEFNALACRCAPEIPLVTLRAIARAESALYPYALSLNYPKRTAREHGL
jgi:hypothetical protein